MHGRLRGRKGWGWGFEDGKGLYKDGPLKERGGQIWLCRYHGLDFVT